MPSIEAKKVSWETIHMLDLRATYTVPFFRPCGSDLGQFYLLSTLLRSFSPVLSHIYAQNCSGQVCSKVHLFAGH